MMRYHPKYFTALATLLLAGALMVWGDSAAVRGLKGFAVGALAPFMDAAAQLRLWSAAAFGGETEEAAALRREIVRLKAALLETETLKRENSALRQALNFKETEAPRLKGARVLLWSKSLGDEFLIIDQGLEKGIAEGEVAINGEGVAVGLVKESGGGFGKIGLASNSGFSFEAELLPSSARVLAKGMGGRAFSLELIPLDTPVRRGDLVALNRGSFSRPLLLAEVVSARSRPGTAFQEARAVLIARPETARHIFIIPK